MKHKKLLALCALIVCVCGACALFVKYGAKNAEKVELPLERYDFPVNSTLYRSDEYKKVIDDYKFAVNQSMYDSDTGIAYVIIIVEKKNGTLKCSISENGKLETYIDDRFYTNLTEYEATFCEFKDNKLYIYSEIAEGLLDEPRIYIVDSSDNREYDFILDKRTDAIKYEIDINTYVLVSTLGISVVSTREQDGIELSLVMEGEDIKYIDMEKNEYKGTYQWYSKDEYYYRYILRTDEVIDISKIEKIRFNDKYYEV